MNNDFLKSDSPNFTKAIKQAQELLKTIGVLNSEADPVAIFVVQQCLKPVEGVAMTLMALQKGLEQREAMETPEGDLGN